MGIKNLYQLIQEHCPGAVKTGEIKNQFGRKVAIVSLNLPTVQDLLLICVGCVCAVLYGH